MSLKEELAKIEEEEELTEVEEERLGEIEENIYGLYHQIKVIVEYIDREIPEKGKNEKERTNSEYVKGYEDGVKAYEKRMIDDNKELIKEQNALIIKIPSSGSVIEPLMAGKKEEELKEVAGKKKTGFGLGKEIGDV